MFWYPPHPELHRIAKVGIENGLGIKPPFTDSLSQQLSITPQDYEENLSTSLHGEVFHAVMSKLAGCETVTEWKAEQFGHSQDYFRPMMLHKLGVLEKRRKSEELYKQSLNESLPIVEEHRSSVLSAIDVEVEKVLTSVAAKDKRAALKKDSVSESFDISKAAAKVISDSWGIDVNNLQGNPLDFNEEDLRDYGKPPHNHAPKKPIVMNLLGNVKYIIASRLLQEIEPFWTEQNEMIRGCKSEIKTVLQKSLGVPELSLDNIQGFIDQMSEEEQGNLADRIEQLGKKGVHIHPGSDKELKEIHNMVKPVIMDAMDRLDQKIDELVRSIDPIVLYQRKKRELGASKQT
jgi:hypothetical protein